jgi:uncharacterized protein
MSTEPRPVERRLWCDSLEVRGGEGEPKTLRGHAAVFDSPTEIGRFTEVVKPGAFRNAIAEGQDVRALFNHDPNHVLGRTRAGTVRLTEDATGLAVEIDPPDTQAARDVLTLVKRGDVTGMSFAFTPREGGSRRSGDVRELTDLNLYDVSVVTYPAYEAASVALRSLESTEQSEQPPPPPPPEPTPAPKREALKQYLGE